MKKIKALITLLLAVGLTTSVYAGGGGSSSKPLDGSYPIVLSHGLLGWGEDSGGIINITEYWGGMDDYLRSQGVAVYAPTKAAAGSNESRAAELKSKILYWMAANNYSKVHLFGHSQGGLDTRYMISNLGMSSKVRTLTTISSPHRGSPIADLVEGLLPDSLEQYVAGALELVVGLIYGSSEQDAMAAMNSLTTSGMSAFNSYTPNASGVKYFSYTSHMTLPDLIQHPLMGALQIPCGLGGQIVGLGYNNDGLVNVNSAKWGTYKGEPSWSWYITGLDHLQIVNALYSGQALFDVEGFFLGMAQNAKNNQ
ncbi:MAG: lipase [Leptospiraceae bacterium]|nr:lipase [Leptospiraceae bacterium]MCB1320652.1 lipase [Leptospiraceae bacterium]